MKGAGSAVAAGSLALAGCGGTPNAEALKVDGVPWFLHSRPDFRYVGEDESKFQRHIDSKR